MGFPTIPLLKSGETRVELPINDGPAYLFPTIPLLKSGETPWIFTLQKKPPVSNYSASKER